MGRLNKADDPPLWGWTQSNQWKVWIEKHWLPWRENSASWQSFDSNCNPFLGFHLASPPCGLWGTCQASQSYEPIPLKYISLSVYMYVQILLVLFLWKTLTNTHSEQDNLESTSIQPSRKNPQLAHKLNSFTRTVSTSGSWYCPWLKCMSVFPCALGLSENERTALDPEFLVECS